ncbi:hypothetical protein KIW84_074057 [Lathyrus oleraceus]|uniref:Uncharacterized protein n=1 Tax=Pisum sativum TaxID=3888 RepID=A0A9D4ZXH6_PEA|nr:hypothetical protein KIW84_074057 [Pisum sativum]
MVTQLNFVYSPKELGNLYYILGIEVNSTKHSLLLTQGKYTRDLLAKVKLQEAKPLPSLMVVDSKLSKDGHNKFVDLTLCSSVCHNNKTRHMLCSEQSQVLKQAEYKCLAPATSELLWAQFLLTEPKVSYSTHIVLCDNMSTIALACNSVLRARTKHVELDLFFVREKVFSKQLKVIYVSG